jgi:hypothetical protein
VRKIISVLIVTLFICNILFSFITYKNEVEAMPGCWEVNEYGGPTLNFTFIYRVLQNLSNIIKDPRYPNGREFGTPGEHLARDYIEDRMQEIGLQNITTEKVTADWTQSDTWDNEYNHNHDPDGNHSDGWIGNLTISKNCTKLYLNLKIYYANNNTLKENRNLSIGSCFPILKYSTLGDHNVTEYNVTVVDEFEPLNFDTQLIIQEADWEHPYSWDTRAWPPDFWWVIPRVKGFILMDCFNETLFMTPSGSTSYQKAGFSINGSTGNWIKQYLGSQSYKVRADICSKWRYETKESWNVIGEIPGKSSKIALISGHYDCWWNQGTFDEGIGVATSLGIAKYIIDHHITPEYTLRFIAWSGEEWFYRGSKDYLKDHNIKKYACQDQSQNQSYPLGDEEDIVYVLYPGNFGFNKTSDMGLNVGSEEDTPLRDFMLDIAQQLQYTQRTGIDVKGEYSVWGDDVYIFYHGHHYPERYCEHAVEFDRYPWPGYHRDGKNHSLGDVFSDINDSLFRVDCELIAEIMLRLTCSNYLPEITAVSAEPVLAGVGTTANIYANVTDEQNGIDQVKVNITYPDNSTYNFSMYEMFVSRGNYTCNYTSYYAFNGTYSYAFSDTWQTGEYAYKIWAVDSTGNCNISRAYHFNVSHLLGYTERGDYFQNIHDRVTGAKFTANEYGTAENITVFLNAAYMSPGPYQCMIYRANDSILIGNTTDDWSPLYNENPEPSSTWAVFSFSGSKPILTKNTDYIITCWGNNAYSRLYYNDLNCELGRYYNSSYGIPPNQANFMNESRIYSIYCCYTPDITPPQITSINASPHTVGFGYNVTITANVTDNSSGVNLVKAYIGEPGGRAGYYTMTHISGNMYRYIYTDTWRTGQYNYSIYAQDNNNNSNTSAICHFHVSADLTISIATLKDSYSGSQYINITDPPNQPENITLISRGLTWDEYYNAITGQNILEVSTGPVNYKDNNSIWTPINNTLTQLPNDHPAYNYGYRTGNNRGPYGTYFKPNMQDIWPVAFTYNRLDDPNTQVIRSKLVGVGYVDPQNNWVYQYLQNVQSSQGQTNGNSITYEDVFTGTDVTWSYGNTELKEEITLSNATKTVLQNHPPSMYGLNTESSYLVFITKLDHQNLNLYNASGKLIGNVTISDAGVDFKDALGQFKCALPLGDAYELNNESVRQKLTYRIVHLNGDTYLLSGLKLSDLNAMTFPVVIDPTLTVYSTSSDGYIYKSSGTYNTAWTASTGTVSNSATYISIGQKKDPAGPPTLTYSIFREFVFFNTSSLPSNAYLDNATLSLYKKDDYSVTDFEITVQNGQPTYPHNPMQSGDYNKNDYSGNGGRLNTSLFSNGYNAITLRDLSWINKTGTTKLCLRSSRDINGNVPTGNEYVNVYANEQGSEYQPKLVIAYRNQSKIKNTGSTNIKGYLLIQVQFYNTSQSKWIVDNDTINETTSRTITSGSQLGLDTIFNGKIRVSNLQHGTGNYRVYAAFRDPERNILKTNSGVELKAWWQFNKA